MVAIALAGLLGGFPTAALLWSEGPTFALLCAPFGGSAAGLGAGLAIALVRWSAARRGIILRGPADLHPYSAQALTLRR